MHAFERWLREHYSASPPFGHCLRADHRERWIRLHSLPESKRYADDDTERAEVRRRAWAAASEVLPTGSPVWLVTVPLEGEPDELRLADTPSLVFERAGRYEHVFDGPVVTYVAKTAWPHVGFDPLIDRIASSSPYDRIDAVWFSEASGEAFAPYDGGIDLILESPQRAETLRHVFPPDWFSKRADGL